MAADINAFTFTCRFGKDPELRNTADGKRVVSSSVAITDWNNKPIWIDVDFWQNLADIVARFAFKGTKATISGRITTKERQTKDGKSYNQISVIANSINIISAKAVEQAENYNNANNSVNYPVNNIGGVQATSSASSYSQFVQMDDEEGLPF